MLTVNHGMQTFNKAYEYMRISPSAILGVVALFFSAFLPTLTFAMVKGPCSNCHTMHNSQNGIAMNFDGSNEPNTHLLRTSGCVGCHAQGGSEHTIIANGNAIPQVMHTNGTDLAAGNFAYINGLKGSGASQAKGHNVIDLLPPDTIHLYPPGGPYKNAGAGIQHPDTMPGRFTCAGLYGCHGNIHIVDPMASMQGAHHAVSSNKPLGATVGDSFRFLIGQTGLEVDDWQNTNSTHHNEYKAASQFVPQLPGGNGPGECGWCHPDKMGGLLPAAGSDMGDFCLRCHPLFHSWVDQNSAWFRHPSNVALPGGTSEYANYTEYNVDAPVARKTLPDSISSIVTPYRSVQGVGYDYVNCISCHKAHATDHEDLLRWDYANIEAGNGTSDGEGCIICHTSKDD